MKKIFLLILFAATLFSCNNYEFEYKQPLAAGGPLQSIIVSPSKSMVYMDFTLPQMHLICIPSNAGDTTVTWSSSHPSIISVDARTGELTWGTAANQDVVITATSNYDSSIVSTSTFTVRNTVGMYKFIDFSDVCGLWILDRNVGALGAEEVSSSPWAEYYSRHGQYFQFGMNNPAADLLIDGPITNNYGKPNLRSGTEFFDAAWIPDSTDSRYNNWAEQGPCPKGWHVPSRSECDSIIYYCTASNFFTVGEKAKANSRLSQLNLPHSGLNTSASGLFNEPNWYWTSDYDWSTKKAVVWGLDTRENKFKTTEASLTQVYNGSYSDLRVMSACLPIRCVRKD